MQYKVLEKIKNANNGFVNREKVSKNRKNDLQIPDSPPDCRTLSNDKVRFLLFCEKIWCISAQVHFLDDNPDDNHAFLEITVVWISFSMRSALSRRIARVR